MGTVEVAKGGLDPVSSDLEPLIFLYLGTLASLVALAWIPYG